MRRTNGVSAVGWQGIVSASDRLVSVDRIPRGTSGTRGTNTRSRAQRSPARLLERMTSCRLSTGHITSCKLKDTYLKTILCISRTTRALPPFSRKTEKSRTASERNTLTFATSSLQIESIRTSYRSSGALQET